MRNPRQSSLEGERGCGPVLVPGGGEVLQLSMRRTARLVAFAQQHEHEDVVAAVTGADRFFAPGHPWLEHARRAYKLIRKLTRSRALARHLALAPARLSLARDYALFFPIFDNPYELFALQWVPEWRKRCRRAVCFIAEIWLPEVPDYLLELLAGFDHVFLGVQHPVSEVARLSGCPTSYLPLAADVLTFAPKAGISRSFDVCNIGRRSPVTHGALLELARRRECSYFYDTVSARAEDGKQRTFTTDDSAEHRLLYSSVLQRTRYFIANRARVNEPEKTAGHEEISGRYYEGAAAGTVMLGVAPDCTAFREQFDWEGAALPMPFDCPEVGRLLRSLDAEPERLSAFSRENMRQAARRHDWLHRLEVVFRTVGLEPTEGMRQRRRALEELAGS